LLGAGNQAAQGGDAQPGREAVRGARRAAARSLTLAACAARLARDDQYDRYEGPVPPTGREGAFGLPCHAWPPAERTSTRRCARPPGRPVPQKHAVLDQAAGKTAEGPA